jgi:hypothetical protein
MTLRLCTLQQVMRLTALVNSGRFLERKLRAKAAFEMQ